MIVRYGVGVGSSEYSTKLYKRVELLMIAVRKNQLSNENVFTVLSCLLFGWFRLFAAAILSTPFGQYQYLINCN